MSTLADIQPAGRPVDAAFMTALMLRLRAGGIAVSPTDAAAATQLVEEHPRWLAAELAAVLAPALAVAPKDRVRFDEILLEALARGRGPPEAAEASPGPDFSTVPEGTATEPNKPPEPEPVVPRTDLADRLKQSIAALRRDTRV